MMLKKTLEDECPRDYAKQSQNQHQILLSCFVPDFMKLDIRRNADKTAKLTGHISLFLCYFPVVIKFNHTDSSDRIR